MNLWNTIDYLEGSSMTAVGVRLFLATLFGCLIGWERIVNKQKAGIRTFALVSLGAAVATVLNLYLVDSIGESVDASRIPAGVVSGIGFLGAGTIIVTGRNQIKGLTTAATMWVTASMGMAIGAGYLGVGVVCFVLVMITNRILFALSRQVEEHSRYISIYLEVEKAKGVIKLRQYISETGYDLNSMNKTKEKTLQASDVAITIELDMKKKKDHMKVLEEFAGLEYVNYLEEV